jgi:hypothetical protein
MITTALYGLLIAEVVWAAVLLVLLAAAMLSRQAAAKRAPSLAAVRPVIEERLMVYAGGNSEIRDISELAKRHPDEVKKSILRFHEAVGGYARDRLCELAHRLGFVEQWCEGTRSADVLVRRTAFSRLAAIAHNELVRRTFGDISLLGLSDCDEQVRLWAARALAESTELDKIAQAFDFARQSDATMVQAILIPALRRHAIQLCERAVPAALRSSPAGDLAKTVRLLVSWECSLPLDDVYFLADHPDATVRAETMRLLAYLPTRVQNREALMRGLTDDDVRVSLAAVSTVGRLKCIEAILPLSTCLRRNSEELARAAAAVLAEMPPEGWRVLENQLWNPDPIASEAAQHVFKRLQPAGGA